MTKQLYEEALADVKRVKEVAEANAQRAVLDAVTPRIRDFIERELLKEAGGAGSEEEDDMLFDDEVSSAISPPDESGNVTLDISALKSPDSYGEYELNSESVRSLSALLRGCSSTSARVAKLAEVVDGISAKAGVDSSVGLLKQVRAALAEAVRAYEAVQESVTDKRGRAALEEKLEGLNTVLGKIQESTMSKMRRMVNEDDMTFKVTGLPNDIDLDSVAVDLITGEAGAAGEGDDDGDEDEDDFEAGDEDGDEDEDEGGDDEEVSLDDLDLGGGDEGDEDDEEQDTQEESRRRRNSTVIEIDEGMLRREIARMRRIREETVPSTKGKKPGSKEFKGFGGATSDGEPLDEADDDQQLEVVDDEEQDQQLEVVDDEEQDQMDEEDIIDLKSDDEEQDQQLEVVDDDLDQIGDRRTRDDIGGSATSAPSADRDNPSQRCEVIRRRIKRALAEQNAARRVGDRAGYIRAYKEIVGLRRMFVEQVQRTSAAKKLRESRANRSGSARTAVGSEAAKLRAKLSETNLINAKLLYTNKLLQNESLSSRQKVQVIEQLDGAKTVREAKLVYESLTRTLAGRNKPIKESRVFGSSSRATNPSSAQQLTEGFEADRWAKLAGINR